MELLEGEKIILRTSPHPLSFWMYYTFFIYYIILGIVFVTKYDDIYQYLSAHLLFKDIVELLIIIIWIALIIIPAVIFSVVMISWRWLLIYSLIGFSGIYALIKGKIDLFTLQYVIILIGVVGVVLTETYRKSHEYFLTNYRVIARLGFLGIYERELFYSRIVEVFLKQGFLGKIFDYGTIIPVTASGIGTGEDVAQVSIGMGGAKRIPLGPSIGGGIAISGEKSVKVPRGRSSFVLFGIPEPQKVKKILLEKIKSTEAHHYLERQVELLEKLVNDKDKNEE